MKWYLWVAPYFELANEPLVDFVTKMDEIVLSIFGYLSFSLRYSHLFSSTHIPYLTPENRKRSFSFFSPIFDTLLFQFYSNFLIFIIIIFLGNVQVSVTLRTFWQFHLPLPLYNALKREKLVFKWGVTKRDALHLNVSLYGTTSFLDNPVGENIPGRKYHTNHITMSRHPRHLISV